MVAKPWTRAPAASSTWSENAADLLVLAELITSGKVTPVIDKTYPLSQAPDAIRYMQEGHARGKVVITI
jgi:NADPH:quinone reductase-like Zn-dependent oxidoreductase